jgi:hypothetical protein
MNVRAAPLLMLLAGSWFTLSGCFKHPETYQRVGLETVCRIGEELVLLEGVRVRHLRGALVNAWPGKPPPGSVKLRAFSLESEAAEFVIEVSSDGLFDFGPMPAGVYRLEVCEPGWNSVTMVVVIAPGAPDDTIEIEVRRAGA